jgi:hypothetical protein
MHVRQQLTNGKRLAFSIAMSMPSADFIRADDSRGTVGRTTWILTYVLLALVIAVHPAVAQSQFGDADRPSPVADVAKQVLTDPTTYVPVSLLYVSTQLDWNSSQPLFQLGYFEDNPRYTQTGRPHDTPMSYGAGNHKLLMQSLAILPSSMANNAINRVVQRGLTARFPNSRKLWSVLAWTERAAFASCTSYVISSPHFEQWKKNQQMIKAQGN